MPGNVVQELLRHVVSFATLDSDEFLAFHLGLIGGWIRRVTRILRNRTKERSASPPRFHQQHYVFKYLFRVTIRSLARFGNRPTGKVNSPSRHRIIEHLINPVRYLYRVVARGIRQAARIAFPHPRSQQVDLAWWGVF